MQNITVFLLQKSAPLGALFEKWKYFYLFPFLLSTFLCLLRLLHFFGLSHKIYREKNKYNYYCRVV